MINHVQIMSKEITFDILTASKLHTSYSIKACLHSYLRLSIVLIGDEPRRRYVSNVFYLSNLRCLIFVPKGLDKRKDFLDNFATIIAHWTTLRFSQKPHVFFLFFFFRKEKNKRTIVVLISAFARRTRVESVKFIDPERGFPLPSVQLRTRRTCELRSLVRQRRLPRIIYTST